MPLPRPRVDNRYRSQEVDLQPYGNTVSVEADSDNPFEDTRDVEIFTQASGGMAGPDPRQRSRGVMVIQRLRPGWNHGASASGIRIPPTAAAVRCVRSVSRWTLRILGSCPAWATCPRVALRFAAWCA